jgi:hypothetical protein
MAPDADTEAYSLIGLECLDWACGEAMPTGTGAAVTEPVLRQSMGRGGIPIAADPVSDCDTLAGCGYDHTRPRQPRPPERPQRNNKLPDQRRLLFGHSRPPFVLGRTWLFSAGNPTFVDFYRHASKPR